MKKTVDVDEEGFWVAVFGIFGIVCVVLGSFDLSSSLRKLFSLPLDNHLSEAHGRSGQILITFALRPSGRLRSQPIVWHLVVPL